MEPSPRWFHVIVSTYGSWLPGDPRGFRTRHHREHVEGDYKNPPTPGIYDDRHARSRHLLKQPPVVFPAAVRPVVGVALHERLVQEGAEVICLSVGGQHAHVQARMPPAATDHWVGLAKRHVTFVLRDRGWEGRVWGKRGKVTPIRDRPHQENVFHYIRRHAWEGAWVWCIWDGEPKAHR
jgi:hypothetical protein